MNMSEASSSLERLRHELSFPPFHDFIRPLAHGVDDEAGTVSVRLPFRPEFCRDPERAFYHGGVLASLIDIVAHATVAVRVARTVPTIELRVDYVRPAPAGDLFALGRLIAAGQSIGRADVEVRSSENKLVALGRGSFSTLKR
jgi:uncharacterized protein (TIGR00369 family)